MNGQQVNISGQDIVIMSKGEYTALVEQFDMAVERRRVELERNNAIDGRYLHRVLDRENPIKVYREWRGLQQNELAEKVGVAASYISNLESGKRKGDIFIYAKIARALDLDVDALVPLAD